MFFGHFPAFNFASYEKFHDFWQVLIIFGHFFPNFWDFFSFFGIFFLYFYEFFTRFFNLWSNFRGFWPIFEIIFFIKSSIFIKILSNGRITVLQRSEYNDYGDYAYDLNMNGASPIMVYGLLFTCLISLMILFASRISYSFPIFS